MPRYRIALRRVVTYTNEIWIEAPNQEDMQRQLSEMDDGDEINWAPDKVLRSHELLEVKDTPP